MAKNKVMKVIKFLEQCLRESGLHTSKIILFGSQSKGTAARGSDIDVVIVSDDFKGKNIFERARLTKDAEIKTIKKFILPLDILTMTRDEWKKSSEMLS
jgi:predicted nucleotidyltransferase